jgi:hypothetical protein
MSLHRNKGDVASLVTSQSSSFATGSRRSPRTPQRVYLECHKMSSSCVLWDGVRMIPLHNERMALYIIENKLDGGCGRIGNLI